MTIKIFLKSLNFARDFEAMIETFNTDIRFMVIIKVQGNAIHEI